MRVAPPPVQVPAARRRISLARAIGLTGRALVAAGLLLLLFTAYLLWGTNVSNASAQRRLRAEIEARPPVAAAPAGEWTPPSSLEAGDPLFTIVIGDIALRTVVVEGVDEDDLRLGPGHFPGSPWPGGRGNLAIAGHRTTFGAPFYRLDELEAGDEIRLESGSVVYRYTVSGTEIVSPDRVDVVADRGRNEITLTTCNPRFSAAQRLIVHADYTGASAVDAPAAVAAVDRAEPVPDAAVPASVVALAVLSFVALLAAMALSPRLRGASVAVAATSGGLALLWVVVFPQVIRVLPAQY